MQRYTKSNKKSKRVIWQKAPDVGLRYKQIISALDLPWKNKKNIFFYRSQNAKTRSYARIWGLSRIWQKALKIKPSYIIEVISEHFDNLSDYQKNKILLHEISHIPLNFSGALTPHFRKGKRKFSDKVNKLLVQFERNLK